MAGKSIKAKAYKNNNFEKTREYLKLNYKNPEFSIGFRWVLRAKCGYKLDALVAKAAKIIEEDCPERCPCCYRKNSNPRLEHWFSKCYLFCEFRMKYFKDIEILYEIFYIISKYCPISNSNADIIDLNYKEEWNILFKNQIISGDYSKKPFLVRSAALFTEIMPRASTRQGLLFRKYKRKLTRSVNTENAVKTG